MTHANEHPEPAQRRRSRLRVARVARAADAAAAHAGRAALAYGHTARDAVRRRPPREHDAQRARGVREGAAALDDTRDRQAGGAGAAGTQAAPDRPAPGDGDRDGGGLDAAQGGAPREGSLAGAAAQGADSGGEGGAAGGGA